MKFLPLTKDSIQMKLFELRRGYCERSAYSDGSQELIYANLIAGTEGKIVAAALILNDGLPEHRALAEGVIRDFCANAEQCDGLSLLMAMEVLQMYPPKVLKQPEYQRLITKCLESSEETSEGRIARHLQARSEGRRGSAEGLAEFPHLLPWWTRLFRSVTSVFSNREP